MKWIVAASVAATIAFIVSVFFIAFLIWTFVFWSMPISREEELLRTFVCRFDFATDQLTFRPDGTYRQQITFDDGRVLFNDGKWTLDSRGDVNLQDAVLPADGFGIPLSSTRPTDGIWTMGTHHTWKGKPYITFSEDLGLHFE